MPRARRRRKKLTLRQRIQNHFRNRMLSGLLVIVPIGVTLLFLRFFYTITAGYIAKPLKVVFGEGAHDYAVATIAVILFFTMLYVTGMIAAAVIGKRVIRFFERLIDRIPFVKTIYGASKQVVETISLNDAGGYKSAVLLEFPRPGLFILGFMTGEIWLNDGQDLHYTVFVPTTPNPTSGYLEVVPANQVRFADMSVEEALKMIVSGGIVSPNRLNFVSAPQPAKRSGRAS